VESQFGYVVHDDLWIGKVKLGAVYKGL